jgi:hypothetical protein
VFELEPSVYVACCLNWVMSLGRSSHEFVSRWDEQHYLGMDASG